MQQSAQCLALILCSSRTPTAIQGQACATVYCSSLHGTAIAYPARGQWKCPMCAG
jgi:hypothetical protein